MKERNCEYQEDYQQAKREFLKALKDWKNRTWNEIITQDESTPGHIRLWRRISAGKRSSDQIPDLLGPDGRTARTDKEKAEILAAHYSSVHNLTTNLGDPMNVIIAQEMVRDYLQTNESQQEIPVTPEELKRYLKKLKKRKAPGEDGMPNQALKNLPDEIIHHLTEILNASLRIAYFPNTWKTAMIKALPKPGKKPRTTGQPSPHLTAIGTGQNLRESNLPKITLLPGHKQPSERNPIWLQTRPLDYPRTNKILRSGNKSA